MTRKPTILIIAGGNNSRFFPLNTQTHKGFIELLGKPLVIQGIEDAQANGFTDFVLVVAHRDYESGNIAMMLEKYNLTATVKVVLQEEAKGMADAVLSAQEYLGEYFVLASPYYTNMGQISELLWNKQQETQADCVFLASETSTPELYGILEVDNDKVLSIVEKPKKGTEPSNLKASSIYLLNQTYLKTLMTTAENEYALEDAFTQFAQTNFISYELTTQKLPSLKYAWHLLDMFDYLIQQQSTLVSSEATIATTAVIDDSKGPVIIQPGATIGHAAKVVGPCYIGQDTLVGDFSFVRHSAVEANAVVGANTEVVRSIVMKGANIHYGYLADSIIGPHSKIGAGLITGNKRFDRQEISTILKEKPVNTQLKALGVITGEKTTLGIRVSTMPGVLIGAEAVIYPSKTIYKNVSKGEVIK